MPDPLLRRTRLRLDPAAFAGDANQSRTPGLHLTDVLRDIELVANGGKSKFSGNGWSEDMLDDAAIQGFLWEEAMTETLRGRVVKSDGAAINVPDYRRLPEIAIHRSGQHAFFVDSSLPAELLAMLTYNHLLLTPDGMRECEPPRLIECKWTLKSARMDPSVDKRVWFQQVKAYLLALSIVLQRRVTTVEWHIHFARGEYKGGEPPIYELMEREFSSEEIMGTWAMVLNQIEWRLRGAKESGGGTDPHGWSRFWDPEWRAA